MKWSYGVTTVGSRRNTTLPATLASLKRGGFERPRLFIDDGLRHLADYRHGLPVTVRDCALGVVGNTVLALYELYHHEPHADRYLLFQDDCACVQNLRDYLTATPFPQKGYGNLYTMQANEPVIKGKPRGWMEASLCNPDQPWQTGRGAVALLFTNEGLRVLLQSPHLVEKPRAASRPTRCIDGAIVNAMNHAGWREYVHNPSLVQHTGNLSSIGSRPHPQARSFPGVHFDARSWLQ